MTLRDRVALVTGADRGIGRAIALALDAALFDRTLAVNLRAGARRDRDDRVEPERLPGADPGGPVRPAGGGRRPRRRDLSNAYVTGQTVQVNGGVYFT